MPLAPICSLALTLAFASADDPTFTEHVAPILFQNCTSCHRPGEGAPFHLLSYADARRRGHLMKDVLADGTMPPWPPAKGWGHFQDERRLADDQIRTIGDWVDAGMPEGPAEKLPPLPKFAEGGWQLGTPDLVVTLAEPYHVPASGADIYRMFVLPLDLPKDEYVTAVEIRPTARSVVHHALYFLDSTGGARKLDEADPGPGFGKMGFARTGSLGGWAVGATPRHLPMGLGYPLAKGADLVVQMHFHPSGKAEREQTTFGLYFAKKTPEKRILGTQAPLLFGRFSELSTQGIRPGDADFKIKGEWEVPFDIDVVLIGGHAHYLCTTMKATAETPDGAVEKLFAIDDWDFNWQGRYNYVEPVRLPKGTIIRTVLTYDNSEANPRNPANPPVHVRWGEGSTDEMGSITLAFVAVNEGDIDAYRGPSVFVGGGGSGGGQAGRLRNLTGLLGIGQGGRAAGGAGLGGLNLEPAQIRRLLEARDTDQDGNLSGEEIPPRLRPILDRIDRDGDGVLGRDEIRTFLRLLGDEPGDDLGPGAPDLDGRVRHPFAPDPAAKARVLVFLTGDCPAANSYAPEVSRLAREYAAAGVPFTLVHVDPATTPDLARTHAKEYGYTLPILLDGSHALADRAGAKVTPEAAVIASDGSVAYCGRIDDRYAKLGRPRPEPSRRDISDAIDAVLAGKAVAQARVDAVGCPIADFRE